MSIRNTKEQNRDAAARRRERLGNAGYRAINTCIPGPIHSRLFSIIRARQLTVAAAVSEAIDVWATANEESSGNEEQHDEQEQSL